MVKVRRRKKPKEKRKARVRGKVLGTADRPRLSVFRSSKHIFAQLVDDGEGKTLVAASDLDVKGGSKTEKAAVVGEKLAEKAIKSKIKKAVFDRGGYRYHGRVEAVAEGARKGGLEF